MRFIILLVLLTSCVSKRSPQPSDTEFDPDDRNWTLVYIQEMNIALENNDDEAYYFFMQELIKYKYKKDFNQTLPENPRIRILK